MYHVWIDPPGDKTGWIHALNDWDDIPGVLAGYPDIPADNDVRKRAADEADEMGTPRGERDYWGITALNVLPNPLPEGVIMVGPDGEETPDE